MLVEKRTVKADIRRYDKNRRPAPALIRIYAKVAFAPGDDHADIGVFKKLICSKRLKHGVAHFAGRNTDVQVNIKRGLVHSVQMRGKLEDGAAIGADAFEYPVTVK